MTGFGLYLAVANVLGGMFFAFDKYAAQTGRNRVREIRLHLLELAGSVFAIWALMYILHHKNKKPGYYVITYIILIIWSISIIYLTEFTQA